MGQNQFDVRILGQDGGRSISHGGESYWSFGDTFVDLPPYNGVWEGIGTDTQITNSLAYGSDFDPSDCVDFTSKTDGNNIADVMLPKDPDLNEAAVWPSGWVQPDAPENFIYHYYSSMRPVTGGVTGQGSGLAKMDLGDLMSDRKPASGTGCDDPSSCLFWKESILSGSCSFDIGAAHPMREGNFVYVFLEMQGSVGLARVLYAQIENLSAYQYRTESSTWVQNNPCAMKKLWEQPLKMQGLEVTYNTFLGKYVATYASGFMTVIYARTADFLWGPWSDEDGQDIVYGGGDTMVPCGDFLQGVPTVQPPELLCYGGLQHPHLERAEGRVIYLSYSNTRSYRAYLQEVVLATAIYQFEDGAGHTAYRRDGEGPSSWSQAGVAFYAYHDEEAAESCTAASLQDVYVRHSIVRVYEWKRGGAEYVYTQGSSPGAGFVNQGVVFCAASADASEQLVPVRRWDEPGTELHVYSSLDLGSLDLVGGATAFFGQVTTYPVPLGDIFTSGVYDILVGSLDTSLFYCIARAEHNTGNNDVTSTLQCNVDLVNGGRPPNADVPPTWQDTCVALEAKNPGDCPDGALNNPTETGADLAAGPPPPPPYTIHEPSTASGTHYPTGNPSCISGSSNPCTTQTVCFKDTGSIAGTGPNIIWKARIAEVGGTVDIWYNQDNDSCKALLTKGDPDFTGLPIAAYRAYELDGTNANQDPAPWRPTAAGVAVLDFDGDGCTDEQELDPNEGTGDCGDDPQNPSDSFEINGQDWINAGGLSGVYDILVTVAAGDCTDDQCTGEAPGIYLFCRADLQHDMSNNDIVLRPYCYWDSVAWDVNAQAYPGITGDGMAGAPPPGPQDANGSYAYGDVNETHTVLTGSFNKTDHLIGLSGCFDTDHPVLGNIWMDFTVSAHQVPGEADIWINQTKGNCNGGTPSGDPTYDDAELSLVQANPNKGALYDQDGDGVPTERELQDDAACGRRDPYNKNDYYDVSIPRDGVIDLPNDILGVIVHFAPGGYPPGDENWDRPRIMDGAGLGSTWNRGSPDGVIDLPNDILGVILQFNAGGCPPLS